MRRNLYWWGFTTEKLFNRANGTGPRSSQSNFVNIQHFNDGFTMKLGELNLFLLQLSQG